MQYRLRCRQTGKEILAQGGRLWPITVEEAAKYNNFRSGADMESVRGSTVTVASHKPCREDEPLDEFWKGDQGQGREHQVISGEGRTACGRNLSCGEEWKSG